MEGIVVKEQSVPGTTLVEVEVKEDLVPLFKEEEGEGWKPGPNDKKSLHYELPSDKNHQKRCSRNGITVREEAAEGTARVEVEVSDDLVPFFKGEGRGWQEKPDGEDRRSLYYLIDDDGEYTSADTDVIC